MSATGADRAGGAGQQPSEDELRAAYEAEIKKVRVEHLMLEHVVTLVNLGMRRTGLAPGTEAERDPGQVRLAIEGVRSLLPLVEEVAPAQSGPIRHALSQMQLAFVRIGGQPAAEGDARHEAGSGAGGAAGAGGGPGGGDAGGGGAGGAEAGAGGGGAGAGGGGAGAGGAGGGPDAGGGEATEQAPPKPGEPGPAQRSGRLWVPGQ